MPRSDTRDLKDAAKLIAKFVRDGLEDFHCEHLTEEQMRILNPLIRNSIYTALYAIEHAHEEWRCDSLLEGKRRAIPSYWEDPELWGPLANPPERDKEATRYFKRLHAEKYGLPVEDD